MLTKASEATHMGTNMAESLGKMIVENMKEDPKLENFTFKEDNDMSNSGDLYTVQLANAIYYKSYDDFSKYRDLVINLTPKDLGMPDGAGSYKIPKIMACSAAKVAGGEVIDYTNDNKDSIILETETFAVGTRINRRLIKRGAKGFINVLMKSGSDAINRAISSEIVNDVIAGAATANTKTGGVSYDKVEDAKYAVKDAKDSNDILFGFHPDMIAFSNLGWNVFAKSTDFKAINNYASRVVPGQKVNNEYVVWNGLKIMQAELISVQKGGADVHAVVLDSNYGAVFLQEDAMDTYDGRIPGTPGDKEIIFASDAGVVVNNAEAISVITA